MPRKQVYGKAFATRSFAADFAAFYSPKKQSPAKSTGHGIVDEVMEQLENLRIELNDKEPDLGSNVVQTEEVADVPRIAISKRRNALAPRDVNAGPKQRPRKAASAREEKAKGAIQESREAPSVVKTDAVLERPDDSPASRRSSVCSSYLSPTVASRAKTVNSPEAVPAQVRTPQRAITQRRKSLLSNQDRTEIVEDRYAANSRPLLDLCSDPLDRSHPTAFQSWADALSPFFRISKIAEASYGEVYRLSLLSPTSGLARSDESVLKIIALKPPPAPPTTTPSSTAARRAAAQREKKAALMSAVADVAGEVRLLQRMSPIPGFTNFREVRVMQGALPAQFVGAWRAFRRGKGEKGEFPDPGRKGSYPEDQLWAVIEMQDAGSDLESVRIEDVWLCWDIFWGVAMTVAKGEELAKFEHRDLHLGNVCMRYSRLNGPARQEGFTVPHLRRGQKFNFTGVETTIIDYTLSRAELEGSLQVHPCAAGEEAAVAFLDLERDPALFEGDAEDEYQYEMYRYMRAAMFLDDPLADLDSRGAEALATGRTWRQYHPQTNVVWLHFLLHKLCSHVIWPSENAEIYTKDDHAQNEDSPLCTAVRLEGILKALQKLLHPAAFQKSRLRSAKDLVALALSEGWLDAADVIGLASQVAPGHRHKPRSKKGSRQK